MRNYKIVALAILILGLILPNSAFSAKYKSSEGKMSIVLPVEYAVKEETSDYGKTVKVTGEFDTYSFFISYTLHVEEITDHIGLAKTGMEAFVEGVNGKVTSQADWFVKKHQGVRASIDLIDYDNHIDYGSILAGNIQYQLAVVGVPDGWVQATADKIFKSFKITK